MGVYGNQDGQRTGHGRKLIVLDRDGVINHDSAAFIKNPDEWVPIPGSLEAIARLNRAGYRVVVATNQSGIGRGLFDTATLNEIHAKMHRAAASAGARIEAVFFCPHTNRDNCLCRKPLPGMLTEIVERYEITERGRVPMVGDALRDLECGAAAGFETHLVMTGKGAKTLADSEQPESGKGLPAGTRVHDDLLQFAYDFLARHAE